MTEPVSLNSLKVHLRLDPGETGEDTYLEGLIVAARRTCEHTINRSVAGGATVLVRDAFPEAFDPTLTLAARRQALAIALPGGLVTSVDSVTWRDSSGTNTLDPGTYVAGLDEMPAHLAPVGTWPRADGLPGAVRVSYTLAGLDSDDLATVSQAMLLIIGSWYDVRSAVAIDMRGSPDEIPMGAAWLLQSLTSFGGR